MGRPLKKDVLGTNVIRSYSGAQAGVQLKGYFTADSGLQTDYQIVKQRGAKTFVVQRLATDEFTDSESQGGLTSTNLRVGVLVSGTPAADGEVQLLGATNDQVPGTVAIAKITKRVATDFSGNRYTWTLDNDSSADVILLTAI
jgi:hypothetical protein